MQIIMQLLLMSLCGWCAGEPLGAALQRRRAAAEAYAREFAREYEPYVFAAVPLHSPVPVLHVLSPAPISVPHPQPAKQRPYSSRERPLAYSNSYVDTRPYTSRPYAKPYAETRPYTSQSLYADSVEYEEDSSEYAPSYWHKSRIRPSSSEYASEYDGDTLHISPSKLPWVTIMKPTKPYDIDSVAYSNQEASPTVLYARPSVSGGYTYRPLSAKKTVPKRNSAKETPVLLKIHKYKIIKD